jgi:ethanolamine utilization protein EutQ
VKGLAVEGIGELEKLRIREGGRAMTLDKVSGIRVMRESDVPYSGLADAPAMELARVVTEAATTELGGGFIRYQNGDGELADWTLKYDEVLYVIEGVLEVISNGESFVAGTGEVMVIPKGVTVTYRGERGTKVFFVLQPRDWATRS